MIKVRIYMLYLYVLKCMFLSSLKNTQFRRFVFHHSSPSEWGWGRTKTISKKLFCLFRWSRQQTLFWPQFQSKPIRSVCIFSQAERLGLKQQHFVKMCLCKHGTKGKQKFQTQFEKINSKWIFPSVMIPPLPLWVCLYLNWVTGTWN